ncbi:MAG: hypothetical protein LBU51_02895 [Bacteroidales bacterium]|jgi:hypothetical protein|nr:hypothetical protein [Bacteroidales bacterium]
METIDIDNAVRAYKIYQEYYLRAVILEQFALNQGLSTKDLTWFVADKSKEDRELYHSVTIPDIRKALDYLIAISYICAYEDETGNIDNTKGMITKKGELALQSSTLQSLANSAFFGYKSLVCSYESMQISNIALKYAKIAGMGAIASVLLSLVSIVLSLCK